MSKQHTLDLTRGNPMALLIRFAIPLVLGTIFQQLYAFADTAIVGRCISGNRSLLSGTLSLWRAGFSGAAF